MFWCVYKLCTLIFYIYLLLISKIKNTQFINASKHKLVNLVHFLCYMCYNPTALVSILNKRISITSDVEFNNVTAFHFCVVSNKMLQYWNQWHCCCKSSPDLFSPLGKLAGRAIYFACINLFFFSLWAKLSQYLLDRFSRCFHQMEGICVNFLDQVQFFRFLKGCCNGNQFCVVSKTQTMCDFCNFYIIWKRFGCRW